MFIPAPTVDTDADNNLRLTFWDHSKDFAEAKVFEAVIQPKDIPGLLRDVVAQGVIALSAVAVDLVQGDCPTCKNIRLVDVEERGRTTSAYCPDCRPEGKEWPTAFAGYPIPGGGLAPRTS